MRIGLSLFWRLRAGRCPRLSPGLPGPGSPASVEKSRMDDPLLARIKHLIVETLRLEDVDPAQIEDDKPLIGSGLALDSIDALELVVRIEKEFGIKISSSEESRTALASVSSLAEFIRSRADPARLAVGPANGTT